MAYDDKEHGMFNKTVKEYPFQYAIRSYERKIDKSRPLYVFPQVNGAYAEGQKKYHVKNNIP